MWDGAHAGLQHRMCLLVPGTHTDCRPQSVQSATTGESLRSDSARLFNTNDGWK